MLPKPLFIILFTSLSTVTAQVAVSLQHVTIPRKAAAVTTTKIPASTKIASSTRILSSKALSSNALSSNVPSSNVPLITIPTASIPSTSTPSVSSSDTEAITDGQDLFFVGNISIGTPPQIFSIQIDTGSAVLWVPSTTCTNQFCSIHNRFDSSKSSTFVASTMPFNETYGDGSNAYGNLGTDTVTIAGITIKNQQFGAAISENEGFQTPGIDGLLGLGEFNPNGSAEENSAYIEPLQNMFDQKLIPKRLFSIALHTLGASSGGEVLFGGINTQEYTGNLSYIPIAKDTTGAPFFWAILLESITISGLNTSTLAISSAAGSAAIVDTGSSYLYIPDGSTATEFYSLINAYLDFTLGLPWLDCNTTANLTITFGANGFTFPLSSTYWIVQTTASDAYVQQAQTDPNIPQYMKPGNSKYCYAKVLSVPGEQWYISIPFLQYYYAVFDLDNVQIGFAPQNAAPLQNSTSTVTSGINTQAATANVSNVQSNIATETVATVLSSSSGGISMNIGMSSILILAIVMVW